MRTLLLLSSVLAACGGKASAPEPAPAPQPVADDDASRESIARMAEFRRRACGCLDQPCIEVLDLDFYDFREADTAPLTSDADKAQFSAEYDLMEACKEVIAEGTDGIPGCDLYSRAVDRHGACDAIAQDTRDTARREHERLAPTWADVHALPGDVVSDAAEQCVTSLRALERDLAEAGCVP